MMLSACGRAKSSCGLIFNDRLVALALLIAFTFLFTQPSKSQVTGAASTQAPHPPGQNPDGMHIYIWAGLKSHLPGQHDYPQFLADWSKILTEHGAVVDG